MIHLESSENTSAPLQSLLATFIPSLCSATYDLISSYVALLSAAVKSNSSIASLTFTWCFASWSLDKRHTVSTWNDTFWLMSVFGNRSRLMWTVAKYLRLFAETYQHSDSNIKVKFDAQLPCTRPWQAENFNGDAATSSHSLPVPACTYQSQT